MIVWCGRGVLRLGVWCRVSVVCVVWFGTSFSVSVVGVCGWCVGEFWCVGVWCWYGVWCADVWMWYIVWVWYVV